MMENVNKIEKIQQAYCQSTSIEYRRANGQFFTPRWIASGMAAWILQTNPASVTDPAFGMGILLDECRKQGYQGLFNGIELDERLIQKWSENHLTNVNLNLQQGDFLARDFGEMDAVIANPPYNRFQNRDIPVFARRKVYELLGEIPSGYTNQYALFLYIAISRLRREGRGAFVVPSEFLGTNYGLQVKKFLLNSRRLRHLILFDTNERVFPEAATTACVLLFDVEKSEKLSIWSLSGENDANIFNDLCRSQLHHTQFCFDINYDALDININWQSLRSVTNKINWNGFVPLSNFGEIKRGIATGANEYFLLSQKEAQNLNLSDTALIPCIPSADSVQELVFTTDSWDSIRATGKKSYLFNGCAIKDEAVSAYIRSGEVKCFHERFLTKSRKPWYRLENRKPASLLFTVFGRNGFRVILNRSSIIHLTAFHGFYPLFKYIPDSVVWMYFQTTYAKEAVQRQQRSYSDGLKKLEPGDWKKVLVPNWRAWSPISLNQLIELSDSAINAFTEKKLKKWDELLLSYEKLTLEKSISINPIIYNENMNGQLVIF